MSPLIQSDELGRLKALRRYRQLTSTAGERYDRLIRRIAHKFEVPIAFLTLIDAYQQWFVSCHGVRLAPIDREFSLCDAAFRAGQALVVENARHDPRFTANPLVAGEPNIRFYASVPVRTPDGYCIGTLCIADGISRRFDPREVECLSDVAGLVVEAMERQRKGLDGRVQGDLFRPAFVTKLNWVL